VLLLRLQDQALQGDYTIYTIYDLAGVNRLPRRDLLQCMCPSARIDAYCANEVPKYGSRVQDHSLH
jgi:hypothetical protein